MSHLGQLRATLGNFGLWATLGNFRPDKRAEESSSRQSGQIKVDEKSCFYFAVDIAFIAHDPYRTRSNEEFST